MSLPLQNINTYTYSPGFQLGQYHNAVLCISGNVQNLYLDGNLIATKTATTNILANYSNINQILIGCAGDKSLGFSGYLDDFRMYNYTLNQTQVSNLYINRNIVAYYPFDNSLNGQTPNYVTLAYDASFVGNAATISTSSQIGNGALQLTNTNTAGSVKSYVTSSSGFLTSDSNGLSVSLWFKTTGVSATRMRLFDLCKSLGSQGISVDINGTNGIIAENYYPPVIIPGFQTVYEDFTTIKSIIYQDSNPTPANNPSSNLNAIYYIGITTKNNTYIYPNSFFTSNNNIWYLSNNNNFFYATINSKTDVLGIENSYYYTTMPMQYLSANSRVLNVYYTGTATNPISKLYTNITINTQGTYSVSFAMSFHDKRGGGYYNLKVEFGSSYIIFNNTNTVYVNSGNVSLSAYYKNSTGTSAISTLMQNNPVINLLRGTLCFITLTFTNVSVGTNILSFGANTLNSSGFSISEIGVSAYVPPTPFIYIPFTENPIVNRGSGSATINSNLRIASTTTNYISGSNSYTVYPALIAGGGAAGTFLCINSFGALSNYTISWWHYIIPTAISTYPTLFVANSGSSTTAIDRIFAIDIDSTNFNVRYYQNGTGTTNSNTYSLNKWNHYALSVSNNGTNSSITLYIDGISKFTATNLSLKTLGNFWNLPDQSNIYAIYNFKLYNTTLSLLDIQSISTTANTTIPFDLLNQYVLNGNTFGSLTNLTTTASYTATRGLTGTYNFSVSSRYSDQNSFMNCFKNTSITGAYTNSVDKGWTPANTYNPSPTSNAISTTYNTNQTIVGDWIQMQLPSQTIVTNYNFSGITDNGAIGVGGPTCWILLGSNDGSTWTSIDNQTTRNYAYPSTNNIINQVQNPLTSNTTPYCYYRLVITKCVRLYPFLSNFIISGTQYLSPSVYYKLASFSGTSIYNEVSGLYDGTLTNGASISTSSLSLVASSNQYVVLPPFTNTGSQITISIWYKQSSQPPTGSYPYIYSFENGNFTYIGAYINANSTTLTCFVNSGNVQNVYIGALDVWYHFVWVINGASWTVYINGVATNYTNANTLSSTTITRRLNLGCTQADTTNCFNGYLKEFRVYNRLLSSTEVNNIYITANNINI